jgi:hypothetical protein
MLKQTENEEMAVTVICVDAPPLLYAVISVLIRSSASPVMTCTTGIPSDKTTSEK